MKTRIDYATICYELGEFYYNNRIRLNISKALAKRAIKLGVGCSNRELSLIAIDEGLGEIVNTEEGRVRGR